MSSIRSNFDTIEWYGLLSIVLKYDTVTEHTHTHTYALENDTREVVFKNKYSNINSFALEVSAIC